MAAKCKKFYITLRKNESQHVPSWSHAEPQDWHRGVDKELWDQELALKPQPKANQELSQRESEEQIRGVEVR